MKRMERRKLIAAKDQLQATREKLAAMEPITPPIPPRWQ